MKRDTLFYTLFQRSPKVIFELLQTTPANANQYRFDSVAVKEPKFEIDGVLLPPEGTPGAVYFIEVQFQPDQKLYERIFAEIALYFYRNYKRFTDWQVVVIYPSRSTEQKRLHPHRSFLNGGQTHRIYLDELGDISDLPLWIALMVLTTIHETQAPDAAKQLIQRANQEAPETEKRAIIELITTIVSYKFEALSPKEVEAMLDITFEETRVYRELKKEAEEKGLKKGLEKGLEKGLKKGLEKGLEKGLKKGLEKGRKEEAAAIVMKIINKRLGQIPTETQTAITHFSIEKLEDLSEAILDFESAEELDQWLAQQE